VRDLSLSELYLAPSSVLLLRFEDAAHPDQARALNGKSRTIQVTCILLICTHVCVSASTAPAPLASEMLAQAIELPAAPAAASASTSSTPGSLGLDSVAADLKNGLNNLEKKMPKWMKMGLSASFFYLLSLFSIRAVLFTDFSVEK
jgi:tether containing UBX domain for GLUT4